MKNIIVLIIASTFMTVFVSCDPKYCSDPTAANYDPNAKPTDNHSACEYSEPTEPQLIIKLRFDETQERLDNFGQPATIPSGNAAQSPTFHGMSAHYIELAQSPNTQLGDGSIIYQGAETSAGGSNAVDFDQAITKGNNEVFYTMPLSQVSADTYNWLRVSLTYQKYDVDFRTNGLDLTGTLASFVGFNTYITSHELNTQTVAVNTNQLQGYWAFEALGQVYSGNAPATTVPNPLSTTSPVPPGSCVVTGDFNVPFTITGNETEDVTLIISLSTNNSFEWEDTNPNGIYEPNDGETVVDAGLRGLEPVIE